ncbi:MAG: PP2C family protein-serine/threonine phosphatase [Candidatus Zixiibacteriota bacterium]
MSITKDSIPVLQWPEPRNFKRSIRLEFSLFMTGMIFVLMLVTGYIITDQYVDTVSRNIVEKLLVQARSYSGPAGKHILAASGPDVLMLNNICKKLAEDNSDIYWAGITGTDNTFLAHTDIKQVIASATMSLMTTGQYGDLLYDGEAFEQRNDTLYVNVPIRENNILIAHLGVASSNTSIVRARRQSMIAIGSLTVLMMLLGIPLVMVMMHRKLRPISIITQHLKNINFDNINLEIPVKSRNELGYLSEMLRVMGAKLNIAQKEMIENERITRELEIAREIQAKILPSSYPETASFTFSGVYRSAREVGGDYYDFIEHDKHNTAFLVADVSGKSLPGMLVMLLTRDIIQKLSRTTLSPGEILSQVNRELLSNIKKGMFVTMFYGVVNRVTGRCSFASAGHNPLIVLRASGGRAELFKTRGFPLGMMPPKQFDSRIECEEVVLEEGDWLIQYTDGVNEAQNSENEEFGMERFVKELETCYRMNPDELINRVLNKHESFVGENEQYDDITMVVMKWKGVADALNKDFVQEAVDVS